MKNYINDIVSQLPKIIINKGVKIMKAVKYTISIILIAAIISSVFSYSAYAVDRANSTVAKSSYKKSSKIETIKVTCKKVKSDIKNSSIIGYAMGEYCYYMYFYKTNKKYILTYTSNGTKYTDVDITEIIKEKIGSDVQNIYLFDITCIDENFYITGTYYDGVNNCNFYLKTSDGKDFTYSNLVYSDEASLSHIYKVGKTFIYTVDKGSNMGGDADGKASYYISEDLKNWDMIKTPSNKNCSVLGQKWKLEAIAKDGMIISECDDDDYPIQLYYTKDFKTYEKIENGVSYDDIYAGVIALYNGPLCRLEYTWDDNDDYSNGFKILTSTNYTNWNTLFKYKESDYSSSLYYYFWIHYNNNFVIFTEREKDSSLFIYSNKNKAFTEYSTAIKASKLGIGVYDTEDKDGFNYSLYDNKYILVTNDFYKTTYKIKVPVDHIQTIAMSKNNLIINSDYNYYISIKSIKTAVAASKKK